MVALLLRNGWNPTGMEQTMQVHMLPSLRPYSTLTGGYFAMTPAPISTSISIQFPPVLPHQDSGDFKKAIDYV